MAALILPSRLKKQPQQAAQVDWSNPLNRGTTGLWSLNNGFYVRDLVTGTVGGFSDSSANFLSSASLDGVGLGAAVSSTTVRGIVTNVLASSLGISGANDRTVFGVAVYDTNAGNEALFTLGTPSSGNQDWSLRRYTISANWRFNIYGVIGLDFNYVPPADNRINYVCTQNGTTVEVWINGLMVATTAATINTTDAIFKIGGDTVLWPAWNAPILFTGVANRAWSTAEKAKFFDNPWQLFQAPRRKLYLAASTAAGSGTGTAAASSTAPAAGASTAASTASAAGTSTALATGAAVASTIGSASATSTASATGAATSAGTGTASASSTAPGVGSTVAAGAGTGSASASSTAPAVGASTASTAGSAVASSTATGASPTVISGAGSASGSSTALAVSLSPVSINLGGDDAPYDDERIEIWEDYKPPAVNNQLEKIIRDAYQGIKGVPVEKPSPVIQQSKPIQTDDDDEEELLLMML